MIAPLARQGLRICGHGWARSEGGFEKVPGACGPKALKICGPVVRRGRRTALNGQIFSSVKRYMVILRYNALYFRRYICRISPRQLIFVIKLECRMEYDVCAPLAKLERKVFIWLRFMASWAPM